jgi:hypothetical protein
MYKWVVDIQIYSENPEKELIDIGWEDLRQWI